MANTVSDCTVLIVDIAGTVGLRSRLGEAVAGERIQKLLNDIIAMSQSRGGTFLKSYGDDVLATFAGSDRGAACATEAAIDAQRLAEQSGLQLYAGIFAGPVEFGETMGHPVAMGQTVNLAARLHKLTEDAPGRIFVSSEFVALLPADLQKEASPFGTRKLKGYGTMEVWTIAWRDKPTTVTVMAGRMPEPAAPLVERPRALVLQHLGRQLQLLPDGTSSVLGRGGDCALQVPDREPRISGRHLIVEFSGGLWMAHDISRNGSWIRDDRTGEAFALLPGGKAQFPARGALSMGRPFSQDAEEKYLVRFDTGGG